MPWFGNIEITEFGNMGIFFFYWINVVFAKISYFKISTKLYFSGGGKGLSSTVCNRFLKILRQNISSVDPFIKWW